MTEPLVPPPAADEPTPGMCTCAQHCVESPYHERACCTRRDCGCWCHTRARPIVCSPREAKSILAMQHWIADRCADAVMVPVIWWEG